MSEPRVSAQEFAAELPGWSLEEVVSTWVAIGLKPRTDWAGRASITANEAGMAFTAIAADTAQAEAEIAATMAERSAQSQPSDEYRFVRDEVARQLRGYVSQGAIFGAQTQAVERIRQGEAPGLVIAEVVLANRLPVQATYFGA
jgi:hypothetical protein